VGEDYENSLSKQVSLHPAASLSLPNEPQPSTTARVVIVIPAYKPANLLADLVSELADCDIVGGIIVVDDGSGPAYLPIFKSVETTPKTHVIGHVTNLGKGAALKTGLNYAAWSYPEAIGVVTADADGQHAVADILKTASALVASPADLTLGARQFEGKVPLRSKLGNVFTRNILWAVTGQRLMDTQTGLRGIPVGLIPDLLKSRATGYDFELDMLLGAKNSHRRITEVPISTIYIDGNRSSHFNPVFDSMRIYFVFLRFAGVSLITAGIDNLVFLAAFSLCANVLVSQATGRLIAGLFNYFTNKTGVFHSRAQNTTTMPRYWALVVVLGLVSYGLITYMVSVFHWKVVFAKMLAETVMFCFSFAIQRDFVFANNSPKES
jgi:glycosyltransferase involved in cell wall biosynthesis